jgi:MFS family permease
MAIGVWGGIAGLGGAVAPTLGALLVEWAGWRAVFFVNVPFVAAAFIGGLFVLRENYGENRERFDPVAVPVAAAAVGLLVLAVVQGQPWGWTSGKVIAAFAAAAFALPSFVMRSSSHPRPLLDLDLFRLRSFTVANASQCLFVASFYGWLVLMPSFFEDVWGYSPLAAGFALAPSAALSAILSPLAGRLADRIGHRWLVGLGALVGALGPLWWALFVGRTPHYATAVLPGMILGGLGATAGFATATGAIMSEVAPKHYSMAGAARSTVFQLASAIGIAVAVALLGTPVAGAVAPYARVWWVAAGESLAGAILMVALFPSHPKKPRVVAPATTPAEVAGPAGEPGAGAVVPEPQPAPSASSPA